MAQYVNDLHPRTTVPALRRGWRELRPVLGATERRTVELDGVTIWPCMARGMAMRVSMRGRIPSWHAKAPSEEEAVGGVCGPWIADRVHVVLNEMAVNGLFLLVGVLIVCVLMAIGTLM